MFGFIPPPILSILQKLAVLHVVVSESAITTTSVVTILDVQFW